jgi:hypothetical protein
MESSFSHVMFYTQALCVCINFMNSVFLLNITLMLIFNFVVLLSYHAIHMDLVQKSNCPVATHGYAT